MERKITVSLHETRGEIGDDTLRSFMVTLKDYLIFTFDLPGIDGKDIDLFISKLHDGDSDETIRNIIEQCMSAIISTINIHGQE